MYSYIIFFDENDWVKNNVVIGSPEMFGNSASVRKFHGIDHKLEKYHRKSCVRGNGLLPLVLKTTPELTSMLRVFCVLLFIK